MSGCADLNRSPLDPKHRPTPWLNGDDTPAIARTDGLPSLKLCPLCLTRNPIGVSGSVTNR